MVRAGGDPRERTPAQPHMTTPGSGAVVGRWRTPTPLVGPCAACRRCGPVPYRWLRARRSRHRGCHGAATWLETGSRHPWHKFIVYRPVYRRMFTRRRYAPSWSSGGDSKPVTRTFVVRPLGFEPRTCGLRVRCSAVELEAREATTLLGRLERAAPSAGPGGGWLRGLEPPTSWTTTRRSNQLSYSHRARTAWHRGLRSPHRRPLTRPGNGRRLAGGRPVKVDILPPVVGEGEHWG